MSTHPLEELLHPKSIAVVGASSSSGGRPVGFVSPLLDFKFKGKIYPVNPKYSKIAGLKSYPSIKDIPGAVDYVISAVPAGKVLDIMEECSQKGVKVMHLFTARFSETGRQDAAELEQEILRQARKKGIRIIGPNCMGVYYPEERISWSSNFPRESGSTGLISQSGNLALWLIPMAALRGVRFSKGISYGNAIDFNECDLLDYFSEDPSTKLIMMYLEGVRDGKRFFNTLRQVTPKKPVIILKGGQGKAGTRATASHTASLAGSMEIWKTMVTQAGAVCADTMEEIVDLAASFYFLPPITGRRVGITGGAGGPSVLSADQCEEAGLDVIPLPEEIRQELKSKGIAAWDWLGNPADRSVIGDDSLSTGDILQMMARNQNFDLLIALISAPYRVGRKERLSADTHLKPYKLTELDYKQLLTVVSDMSLGINDYNNSSWKLMCDVRTKLVEANIPFYPTIERAARAVSKLIDYYQKRG